MRPFWMLALLDFRPDHYTEAAAYWQRLTGYTLRDPIGDLGEFQGLRPPDHPTFLAVQRLGEGEDRVHLDFHVTDPPASARDAIAAGATMITDNPDCEVLSSPGGLIFCFVSDPSSGPAPATSWSDGHRSIADQVCIDIPGDQWDAEIAFWSEVVGTQAESLDESEFARLHDDDQLPLRILFQRLQEPTGRVRAHIDWATTDRDAETQRHVALGSHVVRRCAEWTVMDGPGGIYCITDRLPRF
jgi:predicted enzyme related to lactoylglutathione lyase